MQFTALALPMPLCGVALLCGVASQQECVMCLATFVFALAAHYLMDVLCRGRASPPALHKAENLKVGDADLDEVEIVQSLRASYPGVDLSKVTLDVSRDAALESSDGICCNTRLLYGASVVCEWHGFCRNMKEGYPQSGICNGRLSRNRSTLTLFDSEGLVKLHVPELVQGWLLGAGSPEPQTGSGRHRKPISGTDTPMSMTHFVLLEAEKAVEAGFPEPRSGSRQRRKNKSGDDTAVSMTHFVLREAEEAVAAGCPEPRRGSRQRRKINSGADTAVSPAHSVPREAEHAVEAGFPERQIGFCQRRKSNSGASAMSMKHTVLRASDEAPSLSMTQFVLQAAEEAATAQLTQVEAKMEEAERAIEEANPAKLMSALMLEAVESVLAEPDNSDEEAVLPAKHKKKKVAAPESDVVRRLPSPSRSRSIRSRIPEPSF